MTCLISHHSTVLRRWIAANNWHANFFRSSKNPILSLYRIVQNNICSNPVIQLQSYYNYNIHTVLASLIELAWSNNNKLLLLINLGDLSGCYKPHAGTKHPERLVVYSRIKEDGNEHYK